MTQLNILVFLVLIFKLLITIEIVTSLTFIKFPQNTKIKRLLGYEEESLMEFPDIVQSYGYRSETHEVTTDDGYILKLFRILKSEHCENKPPVLMGHGLLLIAESFIDAGPGYGLAYLLSDACFDVWVANQRGTYHGRKHTTLNPNTDNKFWEFSYQEMGKYDQPAFVDHILKETGEKYLNYVGYSQSGEIFNIMCSERLEYNDKIGVSVLLAPGSRMINTKSPAFKLITGSATVLKPLYEATGTYELLSKDSITQTTLQLLCSIINRIACETFLTLLDSYHAGSIADRTLKVLSGHMPSGTSRQALEHFNQAIKSDNFLAFDHGKIKNKELYGTETPPAFNLTAVTTKVVIMAGLNDHTVDIKDIKWLASQLPNILDLIVIKDEQWNHFDFVFSQFIPEVILPTVIKYLNDNS